MNATPKDPVALMVLKLYDDPYFKRIVSKLESNGISRPTALRAAAVRMTTEADENRKWEMYEETRSSNCQPDRNGLDDSEVRTAVHTALQTVSRRGRVIRGYRSQS